MLFSLMQGSFVVWMLVAGALMLNVAQRAGDGRHVSTRRVVHLLLWPGYFVKIGVISVVIASCLYSDEEEV